MQVSLVPVHLVDNLWPHVSEGFQRASKRFGGDITVGELWTACRSGHVFFFVVQNDTGEIVGATIFRSEAWGKGQRFRCLAMYGIGIKLWRDVALEHVVKVAKLAGCNGIVSDGREGIGKLFPEAKKVRSVFEMEI